MACPEATVGIQLLPGCFKSEGGSKWGLFAPGGLLNASESKKSANAAPSSNSSPAIRDGRLSREWRLDVPMHDATGVDVTQAHEHLAFY